MSDEEFCRSTSAHVEGVRMGRFLLLLIFVVAAACGSGRAGPAPQYSCSPGGLRPPTKLLLHPDGGIPGEYNVVFLDSVQDISGTATALADKYKGQILSLYTAAIHGFAVKIADPEAAPLSEEPAVCWVEQDTMGQGT